MPRKLLLFIMVIFTVSLIPPSARSADLERWLQPPGTETGYVGSATCARCHANTYATFTQTWHSKILQPADEPAILGDFTSQDPDLTFTRDDVTWLVGGQYKQRYLTEIDGELFVLPAEWNLVTGEWAPYEVASWRSRPYKQYCAGCHTTGFDPTTQTWIEPGVGCEACHGPGADHVASTGNRAEIVNPADLEFQDQAEVCAQCHSRGEDLSGKFPFPVAYFPGGPTELHESFMLTTDPEDFWPDGTVKTHHMQFQDWRQGKHQNSVNCIFCHTAHTIGETDHQTRMVGNDRCTVCHEGNTDLTAHIPYMASVVDAVNCTDCHMPRVSMLISTDFQIQSHTFNPPNPSLSVAYGGQENMPNACNLCHIDQSPEWAVAVLGLTLPPGTATRVPIPTPIPLPTSVSPLVSGSAEDESFTLSTTITPKDSSRPWGVVLAIVIVISGALWVLRKVRSI